MSVEKTEQSNRYLCGKRILPNPMTGSETIAELMDNAFLAYNSARLREASHLFAHKILDEDVTVGMTLAGALTPAGLGVSTIIPLIKRGFVDWIVSTGANLYHDLHFAFDCALHAGTPVVDDAELRDKGVVRIYDIFFDLEETLFKTDALLREILRQPEFQKEMGTAELHNLLGKYAAEYEEKLGLPEVSVLAAAYRAGVPVYTSSPGDSTIGMNIAALALEGKQLKVDPSIDVNETAAIVLDAKRQGGKSAVLLVGGGSPKNFMLQTEPQIQEILKLDESGHDYFIQITDARPDTGGLSGATPSEAVSWGKVNPDQLPDTVVCYLDSTIGFPLLAQYALAVAQARPCKKLYTRRQDMTNRLVEEYRSSR